jgi:predicted lysophospholipase L1 biosynthesis ABC-type transport system permease subunit
MDAMVIGATFVGSIATAFVVQKAVLGVMLRAFRRDMAARRPFR